MKRREFIAGLGGAAAWPLATRAQQTAKLPTIGFVVPGTPASHGKWVAAFVQRLGELGWIEGRTIAIEYRWVEGRTERFAEIAAECGLSENALRLRRRRAVERIRRELAAA